MANRSLTMLDEFVLMGLTDSPELQAPLFGLFLLIYVISLVGYLGMIILTKVDSKLQTPMYFFLRHSAVTDLGYSTTVGPKILVSFISDENIISYYFCALHLAFFLVFIVSEIFILSAMSYDRYVAICNPLLYTVIMSQWVCRVLVAIPYLYSTFVSLLVTIKIFNLSFCGSNVVSHFYCDSLSLLSLLCSNTQEIELIILILAAFDLISPLLVVLVSCLLILVTILRLQDKVASLMYTLVIPMLNPLIYSLRNQDVKHALNRTWKKISNIFSKV